MGDLPFGLIVYSKYLLGMTDERAAVDVFDGTYQAFLFDMDGVLTDTASTHSQAWKLAFDRFLERWAKAHNTAFVPFDRVNDYQSYVDGKRREDGVRDFLASRNITLPEGTSADDTSVDSVWGVANGKNELLLKTLAEEGVKVYPGSVDFVEKVRAAGFKTAVVSSSANTTAVLEAANLKGLFDEQMDGAIAAKLKLPGKPAPDTFVAAAKNLGSTVERSIVFEDALAGVAAGKQGGFGLVVGVDRVGQREGLYANGADVVVDDLSELIK